jgi:hypothetical protein
MIGSSRVGRARDMPSLKASDAAILNDSSFESTWWYEPSNTVALKSTIDTRPDPRIRVLETFLHRGNELAGNRAAEDVVHELELAAARQRSNLTFVAEPPWPPVCFLCRPCASVDAVIVSR